MKVKRCDMAEFGARLRQLRMERGLSMDAFCERYNAACHQHLSKSTVSRWENNTQEPMVSTISSVAGFFGVSPVWLMGKSEDRGCSASNIQNSAVVQGNNAATLIVKNGAAAASLSDQEAELLRVFQSLSVKGQTRLLSFAFQLESEEGLSNGSV